MNPKLPQLLQLPLLFSDVQLQRPLVGPDGDGTSGRRLEQANGQAPVQAAEALGTQDGGEGPDGTLVVLGDVLVHVTTAGGALDLDTLAHQVEREDGRLGEDASHDAGGGVPGAEGEVEAAQRYAQALVDGEEGAHKRHDLSQPRAEAAEEAAWALVAPDVPYGTPEARIDTVVALGGEARAQQVQRVRGRRGGGTGGGAGEERFSRVRQGAGAQSAVQHHRGAAVRRELRGAVADVHQFRRHVALPQARDALVPDDVPHRRERALVHGRRRAAADR